MIQASHFERNFMSKHTFGRWRSGDMFNTVFGPPNGKPCPEVIATVNKGNPANAWLIAAAPEMLVQLEKSLNVLSKLYNDGINFDVDLIPEIKATIAKAKGK